MARPASRFAFPAGPEKGNGMKFGYMPDTHGGPYDQPLPDRDRAADFAEHLVREAVVAEESWFRCAFVPERHARRRRCGPTR